MRNAELFQRLWRRVELLPSPLSWARKAALRARGAQIGRRAIVEPIRCTWPHQIRVGENCHICAGVYFNYNHYWTPGPSISLGNQVFVGEGVEFNIREGITIGDDSLIGAGSRFIDHDHGMALETPMRLQEQPSAAISIGENVWIGVNVVVLKGVTIGSGAIIGAGSVLTRSVPMNEIWAGIPARKIKGRADAIR